MYRFIILIWCFSSFLTASKAQEIEVRPGDFLYGIGAGSNFGSMHVKGAQEIKSAFGPFVGLTASYAISQRWRTNFAGYFSMRSSVVDNYLKYSQNGIDLQAYAQYKVDDFYLNFGLQSQTVANIRSSYKGYSNFRTSEEERVNYTVPTQEFNPMVGLEFKMMDNWRFTANYSISPHGSYNSMQIGLVYRINKRSPPPETEKSIRRRLARRQIKDLRDGALLVRLKTAQPTIEAMKKRGFYQLAEETEKQQRIENLSLIKAFRSAYNFSEVKFFYSDDSRRILDRDFEGIFLNDSLHKDPAIILNNKDKVFTCELAKIEEDTARYFSHYETVPTGNFASKQVPRFYGGGENTFYALVVKDDQFNQLSRPFPYYSRALFKSLSEHPGHGIFYLPLRIFFSDTPLGSAKDLNRKLYRYLEKVDK